MNLVYFRNFLYLMCFISFFSLQEGLFHLGRNSCTTEGKYKIHGHPFLGSEYGIGHYLALDRNSRGTLYFCGCTYDRENELDFQCIPQYLWLPLPHSNSSLERGCSWLVGPPTFESLMISSKPVSIQIESSRAHSTVMGFSHGSRHQVIDSCWCFVSGN